MKRTTGITIVLTALAVAGAMDIAAQDEVAERRRGPRGPGVEAIMQMRDRLELTDAQIADLEAVRREHVELRNAERAELAEMRSQLAAGQIQRSDLMAYMEDRREANAGVAGQARERLDAILNESQLATLEQARGNARAFARGRASAMRGGRDGVRQGRQGVRGRRDGLGRRGDGVPGRRPGMRNSRFDRAGPGFRGTGRPGRGGPASRGRALPGNGFGPEGFGPGSSDQLGRDGRGPGWNGEFGPGGRAPGWDGDFEPGGPGPNRAGPLDEPPPEADDGREPGEVENLPIGPAVKIRT